SITRNCRSRCALSLLTSSLFFFFNHPPPTELYTLSLHDALPISAKLPDGQTFVGAEQLRKLLVARRADFVRCLTEKMLTYALGRSEEHTSELQSLTNLVCRLLLEKKKKKQYHLDTPIYIISKTCS